MDSSPRPSSSCSYCYFEPEPRQPVRPFAVPYRRASLLLYSTTVYGIAVGDFSIPAALDNLTLLAVCRPVQGLEIVLWSPTSGVSPLMSEA